MVKSCHIGGFITSASSPWLYVWLYRLRSLLLSDLRKSELAGTHSRQTVYLAMFGRQNVEFVSANFVACLAVIDIELRRKDRTAKLARVAYSVELDGTNTRDVTSSIMLPGHCLSNVANLIAGRRKVTVLTVG